MLVESFTSICFFLRRFFLAPREGIELTACCSISTGKSTGDAFALDQPWVPVQRSLTFVDETMDTIAVYEAKTDDTMDTVAIYDTKTDETTDIVAISDTKTDRSDMTPAAADADRELEPVQALARVPSRSTQPPATPSASWAATSPSHLSPTSGIWPGPLHRHQSSFSLGTRSISDLGTSPLTIRNAPIPTRVGLLAKREEADLLRHFVENLAGSFDLTDSSRHFRTVVPRHAVNDPVLLNAVLAASARHLARVGNRDPLAAERYHNECLQHLIPMLSDEDAALSENLLASTVILRYLEEIDVPLSGTLEDSQPSHLLGTSAFITAQEGLALHGGLRLAAFWVGLRQEVYVSFVTQRAVLLPFQKSITDIVFHSCNEDDWANRVVIHCAQALSYCFGAEQGQRGLERYHELMQYTEDWMANVPQEFSPLFRSTEMTDSVFPEILYCSDAAVTGIQHYHLARILLVSHDPTVPALGPRRTATLARKDEEIRFHVRELCGLAMSNIRTAPNFVTASMVIAMTGDKFSDSTERQAFLEILQITEQVHGWPTTRAQQDLKEAWGWL